MLGPIRYQVNFAYVNTHAAIPTDCLSKQWLWETIYPLQTRNIRLSDIYFV